MFRIIFLSGFLLAGILSFGHQKCAALTLLPPGTVVNDRPAASMLTAPNTCLVKISTGGVSMNITSNECNFVVRNLSKMDLVAGGQPGIDPVFRIDRPMF